MPVIGFQLVVHHVMMLNTMLACVQRYVFQPEYGLLPADEKRALLEEGICPTSAQLQGCDDLKMNFAIDWNLLHPALSMAFVDMQERHSHILDGLDNI